MDESPVMILFAMGGLVGGIVLFGRGLMAYRRDRLISSVATSSLDGIAAGEVRVSGVVEAIDQTLLSPLQSKPCVWYRARIETTDDSRRVLLDEERAVHFRISDEHGHIRVVPDGARWEIDAVYDEAMSTTGPEPPGLDRGRVAAFAEVAIEDPEQMTEAQRQAAIDALLTVRPPEPPPPLVAGCGAGFTIFGSGTGRSSGRGRYREARLEPGETVTVMGQALPWADVRALRDVAELDSNVERTIADDIAVARDAGSLAASSAEAWGNAAIAGFGIGRPTQPPDIDPQARMPQLAEEGAHEAAIERSSTSRSIPIT